ncbi:hypothetical protein JCM10207_002276 [Rhodosporidiobolus poonsookiae]
MWPAPQPWPSGVPGSSSSSWAPGQPGTLVHQHDCPPSLPHVPQMPSSAMYPQHPSHADPYSQATPRSLSNRSSHHSLRQRSSSNDVSYHPYRPTPVPASSSPPTAGFSKPILFVDTTQQAASAGDPMQQCRPKRKRITPEQLVELTGVFETTDSPSYDVRDKLGAKIGMTNREVQVWFQNRRAKVNRQRLAELAKAETERAAAAAKASPASMDLPRPPVDTLSSGQHQWRIRPGATQQHPAQSIHAAYPAQHTPRMGPPSPRRQPPPLPMPPVQISYRIPHPDPTQSPALSAAPYRSPALPSPSLSHGPGGPSFFPIASPALSSALTPSLTSPSSVASSYFSRAEPPFTPASTISSPSNTFFRLTLDSPQVGPLSPHSPSAAYNGSSPDPDRPEPLIHLPPIRNFHFKGSSRQASRPLHRRSISDSAAHAAFLPPPPPPPKPSRPKSRSGSGATLPAAVRLPSLRGILNDDTPGAAPSTVVSAPTSPVDAIIPLPAMQAQPAPPPHTVPLASRPFSPPSLAATFAPRPRLVSRYSTIDIHGEPSRERHSRPPSPSVGLMQVDEDEQRPPLGLGMLVAAATELSAEGEKETRLAMSQRMR